MKRTNTLALLLPVAAIGFLAGQATSTTQQDAEAGVQEAAAPMPGKMHRLLDPLAGTFEAACTFWMPGAPEPMEMTGQSTSSWILGGHFLKQEFEGEWMGQPFDGIGLTGWSDIEQGYQGLWLDSGGNEMVFHTGGKVLDDGKTIVWEAMEPDAMAGETVKVKNVTVIDGPDKNTFIKYRIADDGSEQKTMEIVYTRK